MIYRVITVRDNAVEAFMPPTFIPHVGAAVREFTKAVQNPQHDFAKSPNDFDLYHISDWDDTTGRFIPLDPPQRLLRGQDILIQS